METHTPECLSVPESVRLSVPESVYLSVPESVQSAVWILQYSRPQLLS